MPDIGGLNTDGMVFAVVPIALGNNGYADANSGTIWPVQGPEGGSVTAVMTNMASEYGYKLADKAVLFDGVDDDILIGGYDPTHTNASGLTVEGRFYWDGATSFYLLGNWENTNNFWECYVPSTGDPSFLFKFGGARRVKTAAAGSLLPGINTVHFTKNGSLLQIWLNGTVIELYDTDESYDLGNMNISATSTVGQRGSNIAYMNTPLYHVAVYETFIGADRIAANHAVLNNELNGIIATKDGDNSVLSVPSTGARSTLPMRSLPMRGLGF